MSAFRTYTDLLRRLHQLIAEGAGDSAAADVIRDDMTTPWTQMTQEEVDAANQLSAELAKGYAKQGETDMRDKKAFDTEGFDKTALVLPVKADWHGTEAPAQIVPDLVADLEQSLGLPEESIKQVLARPEKKFSEAEIKRSVAIVQEIQLAEVGTEAKTQMLESGSLFEPAEERRKQLADIAKQ